MTRTLRQLLSDAVMAAHRAAMIDLAVEAYATTAAKLIDELQPHYAAQLEQVPLDEQAAWIAAHPAAAAADLLHDYAATINARTGRLIGGDSDTVRTDLAERTASLVAAACGNGPQAA